MGEIKKELKQENMGVKANAISKLTYVSTYIYYKPLPSLIITPLAPNAWV